MVLSNIDKAWAREYVVSYGHSFLGETGLADENDYYGRRVNAHAEATYLKRAVGGSLAEQAADVMLTGNPWIPDKRHGSNKTLLIQALINTARKNGVDAVTRQGAEHALRTMCALGSALEVIPEYASIFEYSAGWAGINSPDFHAGRYQVANSSGTNPNPYVEFVVPSDGCHFLTAGRKATLTGTTLVFERMDTGQVIRTWRNENQMQAGTSRNYVPAAIPLRVPAGTRIRVTLTDGPNIVCDGLIVPGARPAPILLMKEPYLADYSHSTAFPNGSDAALDYFNSILDTMAEEFPNVIVADPNTSALWNKNTHILPDGVHPNEYGHQALFTIMMDAIESTLARKMYEAGLYL